MTIRHALIAIALSFGVFETLDILDTGVPALVVAILFYLCAARLLRRSSPVPVVFVGALCILEATQAHTWKHASTATKDFAVVVGTAGIVAAAAFLLRFLRPLRASRRSMP